MSGAEGTTGHADSGWDDYAERVLRNEGRLEGLEQLVSETRAADRKLIEQRSDSLAAELERRATALLELVTARADAVLALGHEERESDRREYRLLVEQAEKRRDEATELLREMYSAAIRKNYEQSNDAIKGLEQRREAATDALEQMVRQWRESDKEARELFAAELARHLDILNHSSERISAFQASSVTRELWQSEKDAAVAREGLLRDQIISLDKTILTLTPLAVAEKAHAEILSRSDLAIAASAAVLDTKLQTLSEKVDDLKTEKTERDARGRGQSAVWGWVAAGLTLVVSVVVLANAFLGQ